jgi:hypothetical protein
MAIPLELIDQRIDGLAAEITAAVSAPMPDNSRAAALTPVLREWQRVKLWRAQRKEEQK